MLAADPWVIRYVGIQVVGNFAERILLQMPGLGEASEERSQFSAQILQLTESNKRSDLRVKVIRPSAGGFSNALCNSERFATSSKRSGFMKHSISQRKNSLASS
jgi:hypothetical protein